MGAGSMLPQGAELNPWIDIILIKKKTHLIFVQQKDRFPDN
jgi:hypothetical protein